MKNLNTNIVLVISIVLGIGLFAGLVYFIKANKTEEVVELPVVLEEFSDFQCPACGAYYPVVEKVRSEFSSEELDFQYKHLPLTTIHEYAYTSAVASEAAREQGKFEEYYRILFENQDNLTDEDLLNYAQELDLDIEKFKSDLQNPDIIARVENDNKEAEDRGYDSTPTFVLNGKRLTMSTNPEEQLRNAIQEKIDQAKSQQQATE
ncbi:MAG TPA: thioredoxin domain-containing protein [Candidatus Dojkabacteria bacterium]|nr:thioredoxin domain-containing protein [Candidatus Dojkabacteria bacterium]HRO65208.1 thioredoxin domain-containing protein [Candidatus Dojkabacteria bacterium]HRP36668.1 thioredoxin domain-containing protein [Candidatus Dojkabacteria bacterium]HRP51377.1 thioredoxin domain-containing protein [Candidatus Dojkabacteria bacterium]